MPSRHIYIYLLSGGKAHDLARVTKNHHVVVLGPYFDSMTPPFGALKSQNWPLTHLESIPSRFPTVHPALESPAGFLLH